MTSLMNITYRISANIRRPLLKDAEKVVEMKFIHEMHSKLIYLLLLIMYILNITKLPTLWTLYWLSVVFGILRFSKTFNEVLC